MNDLLTRATCRRLMVAVSLALGLSACAPPATPPSLQVPVTQAPLPAQEGPLSSELQGRKPRTPVSAAWSDDFAGTALSPRWVVSSWAGFWQRDGLQGGWNPQHVWLNGQGQLVLKLSVEPCGAGWCAQGAELQSSALSGYGRYSYRMRAASTSADPLLGGQPLSGTISAAFSYVGDSATEIDVELQSRTPTQATLGSWRGLSAHSYAQVETGRDLSAGWHDYAYEWRPGSLTFFIDGVQVWRTTTAVPSQQAYVMFNLWPTNDPGWGGLAQAGDRYMLVDSFSFQPY